MLDIFFIVWKFMFKKKGVAMYTAVMEYHFKQEDFEEACRIWKEQVIELAKDQKGFVRMQFLTRTGGYAMAIGTWEATEYAQAFMKTGVFIELLENLEDMLEEKPSPVIWETKYYAEA